MSNIQFANKGELLKVGRDVPPVLKVAPTARELFYQCLIRCDADGRIRSFSACARAAGISNKHMSRAVKALKSIGLIYKNEPPKHGGGFNLEKLVALSQETAALREKYYPQFGGNATTNLEVELPPNWGGYKSLKKKKEGASRNFSSWTDRDDDGAKPMVCSTEVI